MKQTDTYGRALTSATSSLATTSPSAHIDAASLLCHVLDCSSAHLLAWPEKQLSALQQDQFSDLVRQRSAGTPVAYLTGKREFWSLELEVTPATLIPRAETELLIEFVLEHFANKDGFQLADLGTGSGAIAIAIASERPDWLITATDISGDALAVAGRNASKHRLRNIEFIQSHWFESLAGKSYDLIVSNPPYVAQADSHLGHGDASHEPATALVSGPAGMDAINSICQQAPLYLRNNGWLVLEHGYDQKQPVHDCLASCGFSQIRQRHDISGHPRISAGCYSADN